MKRGALILFLFCITPTLIADDRHIDFDARVDFSQFRTFSIRDGAITTNAPELNSQLTRKKITEAIRTNLVAKGLTETQTGSDIVVTYQLASTTGRGVQAVPGPRGGNRPEVFQFMEGTLVIDMADGKSAAVWRGTYRDDERNPSKIAKKLPESVKRLLSEYPPKKQK